MGFKPRTSVEIKVHRINQLLNKIERREISIQESGINSRLDKLRPLSEVWYEDCRDRYIALVKKINS